MNKITKSLLTVGAACTLAVTSFAAGNLISINVDPSVKILVNGSEFKPKDANGNDVMTFIYNGTTYAPLRALAEAYGLEVGYDAARNMATVSKGTYSYDTPSVVTDGMKRTLERAQDYLDMREWSRASLIEFIVSVGYPYDEAVYAADNCGLDWGEQAYKTLKKHGSTWTYEDAYEWLVDYQKFTPSEAEYAFNALREPDGRHDIPETPSYIESDTENNNTIGKINALKRAKDYLEYSAFSYERLIHQLEYEGYTHKEAVYGADNCGADWFEQAVRKGQEYLDYSAFSREGLIRQLEYEKFTNAQAVYAVIQLGY